MPKVTAKSNLVGKVRDGQVPLGIFINSIDPAVTDVVCNAGFDYVFFDGEHGRFGRNEVENHVRAAALHGVVPIVRVLENSQTLIQSMLDVGAQGIVVPHVDTAEDARRAVAASRYSPRGKRGMCPGCYAGDYRMTGWLEHTHASDENVLVIPILESKAAIENIAEICAVDGIDIVHFGPGDLSADMGLDLLRDGHLLLDAWHRVQAAARAAGKLTLVPGGLNPDGSNMFEGGDMYVQGMDLMVLSEAVGQIVAKHRTNVSVRKAA